MYPIHPSALVDAARNATRQQPRRTDVGGLAGAQHQRVCQHCQHSDSEAPCTCAEPCSRIFCPVEGQRVDPLASPDYEPPPVPRFR